MIKQGSNLKEYLGDSVYAEFDGYAIILTTENGLPTDPSNTITIEPMVLSALTKFAERFWKKGKCRKCGEPYNEKSNG